MADGIARRFNTVEYDAGDERTLDAVLATPGGVLLPRAGKRPGTGLIVSVGGSPEAATVTAGSGTIVDTTGGGGYQFALTSSQTRNFAARPSSGTSRIDILSARIRNTDAHPADGGRDVIVELLQGTAGASPVAPTLPAASLQLVQFTVPATGSIVMAKAAQRTVAAGGVLPVADQAERDALAVVYDGLRIYREDTATYEARIAGAWVVEPLGDTGWSNLTGWNSAWTPVSGEAPRIRKFNGLNFLDGAITRTAASDLSPGSTDSATGITLATTYRPTKLKRYPLAAWGRANVQMMIEIGTDGVIVLRNQGSADFAIGARLELECPPWLNG